MSDLASLVAVEKSAGELFRGTHIDFAADGEPLAAEKHARAMGERSHWLADADGTVAGFCCAHAMDLSLYVDELAVARDFQRRGLGRTLMATAIAAAQERDRPVSLITDRTLPWNRPFYESLGFVEWHDPEAAILAELADEEADGFDLSQRVAMILRV